jgi:hypothetical protein
LEKINKLKIHLYGDKSHVKEICMRYEVSMTENPEDVGSRIVKQR